MKAPETPVVRSMAQDLVNWLWAFFFWVIGLSSTLNASRAATPPTLVAVLTRTVMFGVGGAALILCSLTIWREFRTHRRQKKGTP